MIELEEFSSPFIEERLYFKFKTIKSAGDPDVLVPFYRGAVVFTLETNKVKREQVLVPFYRGAVVFKKFYSN